MVRIVGMETDTYFSCSVLSVILIFRMSRQGPDTKLGKLVEAKLAETSNCQRSNRQRPQIGRNQTGRDRVARGV